MQIIKSKTLKTKNVCELTVSSETILKLREKLFSLVDFIFFIKDYPNMIVDTIEIDDCLHDAVKDNIGVTVKGDVDYTKFCEKVLKMVDHKDGNCVGSTILHGNYLGVPISIMFAPYTKTEGIMSIRLDDYTKIQEVNHLMETFLTKGEKLL